MATTAVVLWSLLLLSTTFAASTTVDTTNYDINKPSNVTSTTCGEIVNNNLYEYQDWFYASEVIDCLTSLPFLPDVGTRFIRWYNDTLQYHAATAYLRTPPLSYQQPEVDLFAGLQRIQSKIDAGYYKNQYAFEADVQTLTQKSHDTHLTLWGGAIPAFSFSSPVYITSISIDGQQEPKSYVWEDLVACGEGACKYSAISKINGINTTEYLTAYADQNSFGYVEANADWQNLIYTPAQTIVNGFNAFTGDGTFYPGDELKLTFENSTSTDFSWIASYNSPGFTGPLATAGDFYNFFVLGLQPANFNQTFQQYLEAQDGVFDTVNGTAQQSEASNLTSWTSIVPAYPATMSHQEYLGLSSPGYITGYYLDDIKTAVVSIPSFDEYGEGIGSFSTAIIDFINNATQRDAEKIIIDLQQNSGGQVSLAFDVFRQFFPDITPFAGSRRRSFTQSNLLGDATTEYFDDLDTNTDEYYNAVSSEWVATELINPETDSNFTSWSELFGPHRYNNDDFSTIERYNLSSATFARSFLYIAYPQCYYDKNCKKTARWQGKDIVLLTDGLCTSACTLFVEMMTRDGGARTVTVGGRPEPGPMQAASGSRGATLYSRQYIDIDITYISQYNSTINNTLPKRGDSGMEVIWAGFTLRDQIRENSTVPNQFLYMPADCRIYWSLANFNNYTRLWRDAWNGIYGETGICVTGSQNVKTPPNHNSARSVDWKKRDPSSIGGFVAQAIGATTTTPHTELEFDGVEDGPPSVAGDQLTFCQNADGTQKSNQCPAGKACRQVTFPCLANVVSGSCQSGKCQGTNANVKRWVCEKACLVGKAPKPQCGAAFDCVPNTQASGNSRTPTDSNAPQSAQKLFNGLCVPYNGARDKNPKTCQALSSDAQIQALVKNRPQ